MELEFTLEDGQKQPVAHGLRLKPAPENANNDAASALRKAVGNIHAGDAQWIERVDYDDRDSVNKWAVNIPYQYEINIADPGPVFDPLRVAETTTRIKERALKEMLFSGTCLDTPGMLASELLQPNFRAFPYDDNVSSGMHENISLWNNQGENLFAVSPVLYTQCALSLADIQHAAGLGFLPYKESLDRIRKGTAAPHGIGISYEGSKSARNKGHVSVSLRRGKEPSSSIEETRIENRLPGADADPLVVQALTLAAIVDAVRKHVHKINGEPTEGDTITTSKGSFAVASIGQPRIGHAIPGHRTMVDRLQNNEPMRKLLGSEFHRAILDAYGKNAASPVR